MSAVQAELLELPRYRLRSDTGLVLPLHVERWFDAPEPEEESVIDRALAPVLDVGCGPGRHTLALRRRGVRALGVDVAPGAVRVARRRGVPAVVRSIFDPLPGDWGSALLLDGNVGIGGDPARLLRRLRELLRPGGIALLEVEAPGVSIQHLRVRIEIDGDSGDWFPWAQAGVDGLGDLARDGGYEVGEVWEGGGRWFARLDAR
ncbi:MAG: class I SAM-dependent methyltransferase [Actinomycetota bacterium]